MELDDLSRRITKLASDTAKLANDQMQIAKLNLDIAGVEKEIDGIYLTMGRLCYQKAKEGTGPDSDLVRYCEEIDKNQEQIADLRSQIAAIRAQKPSAEE